jgi:hypothetical protein
MNLSGSDVQILALYSGVVPAPEPADTKANSSSFIDGVLELVLQGRSHAGKEKRYLFTDDRE